MRVPRDKTPYVCSRGRTRIIPDSNFLSAVHAIRKPTRSLSLSFLQRNSPSSTSVFPLRRKSPREATWRRPFFSRSCIRDWRWVRWLTDDSSYPLDERINKYISMESQCRHCARLIHELLKENSEMDLHDSKKTSRD